jgi:hypothetical protein
MKVTRIYVEIGMTIPQHALDESGYTPGNRPVLGIEAEVGEDEPLKPVIAELFDQVEHHWLQIAHHTHKRHAKIVTSPFRYLAKLMKNRPKAIELR